MKPAVDAGQAYCTEPICLMRSRWIRPGSKWDAAHNRRTGGYRGPAHARCNRSEAATFGNRLRGLRRKQLRNRTSTKVERTTSSPSSLSWSSRNR